MLRAICFDLDGTLADTERLGHRPAYNKAFKAAGLSWRWTPKFYRKLLRQPGGGRDRLRYYLDNYNPKIADSATVVADDPEALIHDLHSRKSEYFDRLVRDGSVPLRPGVARLFREASAAGIRLAIVSNASRATVAPILAHSIGREITDTLSVILCGDEGIAKKPAPDLYREALRRMDVSPAEAVAVEDSSLGLRAAVGAGLATVVTLNANTEDEDFSGADLIVDCLGDDDCPVSQARPALLDGKQVTLDDLRALQRRRAQAG